MYQRLVLTLVTAVSLIGLTAVYSVALKPVVEIPKHTRPAIESNQDSDYETPDENRRVATRYLPKEEWAAKSDLGLHSDQAFVYTNEWKREPNNNKRVRFTPFATVMLTTDRDGKESAVTIASASAILEFESEFDEKFKNPGRVVKAMFQDDVRITGPDELEVVGQNFIFDESTLNLSTTYPIRFRYLSHHGWATQMKMKLIPSQGTPGPDRPHVYGIESVRLIGGPNPYDINAHYVVLKSQMPQGQETVPVAVRCLGDLVYTVANSTAVLEQDVRASMGTKLKFTELNCHKLTLQMVPKSPANIAVAANASSPPQNNNSAGGDYQKFDSNLEFHRLEAEGDLVKIRSSAYGIKADMTRLIYRADTRQLSMVSTNPKEKNVIVTRKRSSLKAPDIQAQLGIDNSLNSLLCCGIGELRFFDDVTNKLKVVATWQRQLSMKKDDVTNLDLIELQEKALFKQPEQATGLAAELVKIWLVRMNLRFDSSSSNSQVAETPSSSNPDPKRIHAEGDVALVSPRLTIERANELDVLFDDVDGAIAPRAASANSKSRTQLQPAGLIVTNHLPTNQSRNSVTRVTSAMESRTKKRQAGFANVPAESDGVLGPSAETPSGSDSATQKRESKSTATPQPPIIISADRIRAQMQKVTGSQESKPRDVRAEGKVKITQDGQFGEKAMTLSGDLVEMQAQAEDKDVIHVLGKPAIIRDQRFNLEGNDLNLDRASNRAWVQGEGEMKLPIPAEAKIPGLETAVNRDLFIHWKESMSFDGFQAKFFGTVDAKLGLGKMQCEQMTVQLVNRLSFDTPSPGDDTKPALKTIRCQENVRFENSRYEHKKLVDKYRGKVGELLVDHTTGVAEARGPGHVLVWRRQANGSGGISSQDTIQANRPISTEVTTWDYTRIQFEGRLKGTFGIMTAPRPTRQRMTIDDRVEVTRGPVKMPNEVVNPDELPSMGGTIRCEVLEMVNHPVSKRVPTDYVELVGTGNAEVEGQVDGQRFTASADEISYDGSKGLYTLRAHGPRNARVNGIFNQNGQTIQFNPDPKLRYLNISGATESSARQ